MSEDTAQTLLGANRAFYDAFTTRSGEAMAALWAPGQDVRCIHPGRPVLTGRERVLESWRDIFRHNPPMEVELSQVQTQVVGPVGLVYLVEQLTITLEDRVVKSLVQATNGFVHLEDGWRMLLHHAGPLEQVEVPLQDGRVLH